MTAATVYTFDDDTFSDLHKDAYGFRPGSQYYGWLRTATDDEKQAEWDRLIAVMERSIARDAELTREAIARFEKSVTMTVALGALERTTAVQWLIQAEGNINGDLSYFEYLQGIPYGYINMTTTGVMV